MASTESSRRNRPVTTARLGVNFALSAALFAWSPLAAQGPGPVSFDSIARAEQTLSARIHQTRAVLETDSYGIPRWSSIEESLVLGQDSSGLPRFALTFEGVPGVTLDANAVARRRAIHAARSGFLQQFGSFHVHDPALAAQNYQIVPLDMRVRLGRAAHRVAVIPRQLGRSAWILELDTLTHYPVFRAEVSSFGIVVSTLEVTSCDFSASVPPNSVWWEPSAIRQDFTSSTAAIAALAPPQPALVPAPTDLPGGFRLLEARTILDDLRPESSLVFIYGDGIESLFVVETFGAPPPAVPLQVSPGVDGEQPYALFLFQDQSALQLMSYARGVQTLVIGASGQLGTIWLAEGLLAARLALP